MGSGGRVGEQVPRRAQRDGDGRLAGRQDRRGQRRLRRLEVRGERPDDDEVEGCEPLPETGDVGLAWRRRQEDLLHAREPAAERRCQRRRHRRGRVGRRQVGGHRLDDRDPRVGGRLQRQQPVVVADEGDRTLGQLGGERLMLGAPDDVERRLVVASQPAAQLVQPAPCRGVVVGIDEASPLRLGRGLPPAVPAPVRPLSRAARPRRHGGRRRHRRSGPIPGPGRACPGHR